MPNPPWMRPSVAATLGNHEERVGILERGRNLTLVQTSMTFADGATGEPAFENGWSNFGAPEQTMRFRVEGWNLAIEGAVVGGTPLSVVFTLPVGFRVTDTVLVAGANGSTWQIDPSGEVSIIEECCASGSGIPDPSAEPDGVVLTVVSGAAEWDPPTGGPPSGSAGGVLDGTYPNPGIAAGVAGIGLTETSDVLSVDYGSSAGTAAEGNDARLSNSRAPNGSAGGVLDGSYPNPGLAAGVAGTGLTEVADVLNVDYGTGAGTAAEGNDARLSDARPPNGAAGGVLDGSYPNPGLAAGVAGTGLTEVADVLNVDYGSSAGTAAEGTDARLSDSRAPNGSAGGVLDGTYPNPGLAAGVAGNGLTETSDVLSVNVDGSTLEINTDTLRVKALGITDAQVATANKDGIAGTVSMRTLGTGAAQACAGNDSRLSDSRAPSGSAGGVLDGTFPNPGLAAGVAGAGLAETSDVLSVNVDGSTIAITADVLGVKAGGITGTEIASAIKDPVAGTAGLRTLGTTSVQACAGNDSRLSDSRAPSGSAGGALDGTYPNPGLAASVAGAGLAETSDVLSVNVDGATIEINSDTLRVKADGIGSNELVAGICLIDKQVYTATASSPWGKPTGAKRVHVELWGGGGPGGIGGVGTASGGGGGGGGAYAEAWFDADDLGSSETFVVGAIQSSAGSAGNPSSFGTTVRRSKCRRP